MNLAQLVKTTEKTKRRLGQGHGSGRVKTSGRGTKGQKARNHIALRFEGGALPLTKRLPFLRGKGKNRSLRPDPIAVNVSQLAHLPKHTDVTLQTLVAHGIVSEQEAKKHGIKILGDGELAQALQVGLPVSKSAKAKIEQAGGQVIEVS